MGHYHRLTLMEREELSRLLAAGYSVRATAHVLPNSVRSLLFAFYPLAFVPVLFAVSQKLPNPILVASGMFAGVSYEFYILHFYFLNDRFKDFFPASISLYGQAIIAFVVTFVLAYVISKGAARFKQVADNYLLAGR